MDNLLIFQSLWILFSIHIVMPSSVSHVRQILYSRHKWVRRREHQGHDSYFPPNWYLFTPSNAMGKLRRKQKGILDCISPKNYLSFASAHIKARIA